MGNNLQVPVVIFIFKRYDTVRRIMERISMVKPNKIYLIGDGPRSSEEEAQVKKCREEVAAYIDWDCEVITNFAQVNRGVYENIGLGAKWVFEREEKAIFLEDDNLPEVTFFSYCEELLERYRDDSRVLWINGTNYLTEYMPENGASYMFTKHLLPCGWASWANKFLKYYDGEMELTYDPHVMEVFKNSYESKALYQQQLHSILATRQRKEQGFPISWDFQMAFSIRVHGMYGIAPCKNQIKNIGVDGFSTHNGNSYKIIMTKRFCGMDSKPLDLPLTHPKVVAPDREFEHRIARIILYPLRTRIQVKIARVVKPLLGLKPDDSFSLYLQKKKNKGDRN